MRIIQAATLLLVCVSTACVNVDSPAAEQRGCIETFDPAADYFPEKVEVQYASNFRVAYHNHYKTVTILRASQGVGPFQYVLVQCGAPVPQDLTQGSKVMTIPLGNIFADSVAHIGLLEELGRTDALQGIAEGRYLTGEELLRRFAAGEIVEYGRSEAVNAELVIASRPSAVMTSGTDDGAYTVIHNAGVPVVVNVSWLETSPLGRAEWLKFMAVFLNEERNAMQRFEEIRDDYIRVKATAAQVAPSDRVTVTTGTAFRGVYTVAGGRSYAAGLIADAGGSYVWSDNEDVGSATVDVEQQIHRAVNADIWINGGDWRSLDDMLAEDRRYAEFKAYGNRQVWVYNLRETPSGGNDYWSRGVARPDLVLADLLKIFYPHLAPEHEFQWYRRLEPSAP